MAVNTEVSISVRELNTGECLAGRTAPKHQGLSGNLLGFEAVWLEGICDDKPLAKASGGQDKARGGVEDIEIESLERENPSDQGNYTATSLSVFSLGCCSTAVAGGEDYKIAS